MSAEDKAFVRARMKVMRASLTAERIEEAGSAVMERALALPELASPTSVCCYVSIRRELPTRALLCALLDRGHEVSVPHVIDASRIEARIVADRNELSHLEAAVLGIPTTNGPVASHVAVVLCPGLAFDLGGGRLGYGAGYYDRWLSTRPSVLPVGLSYDEAILDTIPQSQHDVRMSLVLTPTRELRTAQTARDKPVIRVVCAAWIRKGRVLVAKRGSHKARPLAWELPGGKVEVGESDVEALRREIREELGSDIEVESLLGESLSDESSAIVKLVAYTVRSDDEPTATEHEALQWLSPGEIDALDWAPADLPFVPLLRRRLLG